MKKYPRLIFIMVFICLFTACQSNSSESQIRKLVGEFTLHVENDRFYEASLLMNQEVLQTVYPSREVYQEVLRDTFDARNGIRIGEMLQESYTMIENLNILRGEFIYEIFIDDRSFFWVIKATYDLSEQYASISTHFLIEE
jgi:hypothetical protein